jgi:hypothetical protein
MPAAWQLLQAARLTRIIQSLQDVRQLPQQLAFLNRTPVVPADDSEIMARFTGFVTIADLIADDQRAVTYQNSKLSYETTNVPNIKHGSALTQAMLNQLQSMLNAGGGIPADMGLFSDYENRTIDGLLLGVRQRMEALIVAMACDGLSYDRLGIKMVNVTWGMPADLKVTAAITWDTPATATPIADIWALRLRARVRYGQDYNRISMSTQAFMYMIATAEFQAKARVFLAPNVSFTNLTLSDLEAQRAIAGNILGMTLELYDARYWQQGVDGTLSSTPYLPIVKVVLSSTQDDNDPTCSDFANGVTTESIVSGIAPTEMVGGIGGPTRGPISYATVPGDLNPPNVTYWAVARGFPRKHRLQSTAVLTVGTFSDTIAVGPPF